ncbi:MAG: IMPACT family protein [Cellulomonadaceae bacterium]
MSLPSTVAGRTDHEIVVKKSRFITRLEHVPDIAAADAVIAAARKEFWDARHHCTALVVGRHAEQQRSNDDGEPSGTAGTPMLEVLRHRHMTDVVAVVTRYFGGTLLGSGGLVRAYSTAVGETLDLATVVRRALMLEAAVDVPHADAGRIEHVLRDWLPVHDARLENVAYGASARFDMLVPPAQIAALESDLAAASGGSLTLETGGSRLADLPA